MTEEEPPCQTWRKAFAKEQLPYFRRIWEEQRDMRKQVEKDRERIAELERAMKALKIRKARGKGRGLI